MPFRSLIFPVLAALLSVQMASATPIVEVVPRSDVTLQPLNPLRGDASPKAGVLWGDIKQDVPTGTLIEFVDGFSSPPHIHNITYRAVVLSGLVHNDDPEAGKLWMGPGSFWTQPAGENHITAAKPGDKATAFLEILEGPYLVQPASEEFDNGERPVNLEARNVVWLDASDAGWITGDSGAEMAFLWGTPQPGELNGTFLRLPAGGRGELAGNPSWLRAVLIDGEVSHRVEGVTSPAFLQPGSYFGAKGGAVHELTCGADAPCVLYLRTEGRYGFSAD